MYSLATSFLQSQLAVVILCICAGLSIRLHHPHAAGQDNLAGEAQPHTTMRVRPVLSPSIGTQSDTTQVLNSNCTLCHGEANNVLECSCTWSPSLLHKAFRAQDDACRAMWLRTGACTLWRISTASMRQWRAWILAEPSYSPGSPSSGSTESGELRIAMLLLLNHGCCC